MTQGEVKRDGGKERETRNEKRNGTREKYRRKRLRRGEQGERQTGKERERKGSL